MLQRAWQSGAGGAICSVNRGWACRFFAPFFNHHSLQFLFFIRDISIQGRRMSINSRFSTFGLCWSNILVCLCRCVFDISHYASSSLCAAQFGTALRARTCECVFHDNRPVSGLTYSLPSSHRRPEFTFPNVSHQQNSLNTINISRLIMQIRDRTRTTWGPRNQSSEEGDILIKLLYESTGVMTADFGKRSHFY